jgi:hypothetical protein
MPALEAVAFQLPLFSWLPWGDGTGMDSRARRTPDQILRSVIDYLTWRAGECWRNLSFPEQRNARDRWDYLSAARLVETVRYGEPKKPVAVADPLNQIPSPSSLEISLRQKPRAELVRELMRRRADLTDRRLLCHLPRPKLAAMLARAMEAAPAVKGKIA